MTALPRTASMSQLVWRVATGSSGAGCGIGHGPMLLATLRRMRGDWGEVVIDAGDGARPFDRPEIGDDDGLLRIEACGLCGTDHEQFTGALPAGFAFVPGHEAVGVVEAIGSAASARWGVTTGDRVAVEVFQSCRECAAC